MQRKRHALRPRAVVHAARGRAADLVLREPFPEVPLDALLPEGLHAVAVRAGRFRSGEFRFLGETARWEDGIDWDAPGRSPLWVYQLHYLGAVLDLAVAGHVDDARRLLASWHSERGERWDPVSWHPYPVSLRLANVAHAAARSGSCAALGPAAADVLATHATYLLDHLERDVRGNHLLENLRALLLFSRCFTGPAADRASAVARAELPAELAHQVHADGGHFELSPLYHTIVLQRLVELVHWLGPDDALARDHLLPCIRRMQTFLVRILCPDGDLPLLGDSARGFGPPPRRLLAASAALCGAAEPAPDGLTRLERTGLAVWRSAAVYAIVDVGQVCPPELPAHGQADALTFEFWAGGRPFVVDPGTPEYSGERRSWGRASSSHSTVVVDGQDHDEVYGSFRVGGRSRIDAHWDERSVTAYLRPWQGRAEIRRHVRFDDSGMTLEDQIDCAPSSVVDSRVLLAPEVRAERASDDGRVWSLRSGEQVVDAEAVHPLRAVAAKVSREFGSVVDTTMLIQDHPAGETSRRRGGLVLRAQGGGS